MEYQHVLRIVQTLLNEIDNANFRTTLHPIGKMAELVQGVRLRSTLTSIPDLRKGAWVRIPLLSFLFVFPSLRII